MPLLADKIRTQMYSLYDEASKEDMKYRELERMQHKLSEAYLRLRDLIGKEAFDTPHAPTCEQVWETTEEALKKLVEKSRAAQS